MKRWSSMEKLSKAMPNDRRWKIYMYTDKTKKIHKRTSDFNAHWREWERRSAESPIRLWSTNIYDIQFFFPPNHKKWSFHAGARSSHTHTSAHGHRNRIEIETNEHTKANISSNGSSRKKNPIGKFVWGNLRSCNVIEIHGLKTRASHLYSI